MKLVYPDGEFTKEELEEVLKLSLEMRRRVKEQLKKLGAWSFTMLTSLTLTWMICQSIMYLSWNKAAES